MHLFKKLNKYDNLLIICNQKIRSELVRYYSLQPLKNITYKTPANLVSDLIGRYEMVARIKLAKEQEISSEFAKIKLSNSLLVKDNKLNSIKINDLINIKKNNEKYLVKNPLIENQYKDKQIIIINDFNLNDDYLLALDLLEKINSKVIKLNTYELINKEFIVNKFVDYKEELHYILNEICNLLNQGIHAKNIKIYMPSTYYNYAKQIFTLANIDLNIPRSKPLSNYEVTKSIINSLKEYSNLDNIEAFSLIIDKYSKSNSFVLDKIIDVFNTYLKYQEKVEYLLEDIIYTFETTNVSEEYVDGIEVVNLFSSLLKPTDHVFILGISQDLFIKTYKDEEYLLDFERKDLNLKLSNYKNQQMTYATQIILKGLNNLHLSFSTNTPDGILPISSIVGKLEEDSHVEIVDKEVDLHLSYSKKLDEINLGKQLDLFHKYDILSNKLFVLYNAYEDGLYKTYDNSFDGIAKEVLDNYLKDGLTLSYTAIDKYYRCGFLFYLENVLKIRRITNEDSLFIGNLVHEILYKLFLQKNIDDLDSFIEKTVDEYILKEAKILSAKEKFFIKKHINVLKHFYEFINANNNNSLFSVFGLEKEFDLDLGLDIPVRLKGKIDKILTFELENTKYAVVVDYKTGSTDFDLNRIIHGLNMQIMFYFYFLNKFSKDTFEFAGGYLQAVLPSNPFGYEKDKTYLDQLNDYFKLSGYSSDSKDLLEKFDKDILNESKFIKGIRFTNNGEFYATSRKNLISKDVFTSLLKLTEEKIIAASKGIIAGKFNINPKRIGNKFNSCEYCQYKDLCFMDSSNYEYLKEYKDFEFIGGNDDSN